MRKIFTFVGLSVSLMIFFTIIIKLFFNFTPQYPLLSLNSGWTVTYHNENYVNTNLERLSKQVGKTFSRGDIVTLTHAKALQYGEVPFPYLLFKTQFCAYEVFLDNQQIASKYMDTASKYGFIGIGYNAVPLPKDIIGKKLSIKLYVSENETRADLVTPIIGNFDDLYRYLLRSELFPFFVGVFLFIFGFVSLVISLIFYVRTSNVVSQIICSLICAVLGVWMVCAYSIMDFFLDSAVITTLEFLAMYSLVPLLYLLIYCTHPKYNNTVIIFMSYASIFFFFVFLFLHVTGRVHINHFRYPYYLTSLFGLIMLVFYIYMDFTSRVRNSSQILMLGICVLSLSLFLYLLVAISNRIVDYRQNHILNMIIPSGSLFFVIIQLLNHFIYMTRSFAQQKQYASLTKIAYVDNLTGVKNRASFDQKLSEIEETNTDFCILSLDLNGLKEVNDNSGHPAGDRLLKSFAGALLSVFEEFGSCFRIGGDEFVVIFNNIEKEALNDLLKVLDQKLKVLDIEDQEINHSVSYGYAYRSETDEKDTHSVLMLADKRMYDYKRKFYSHMMNR